jgi:alpha-galactosidase
MTRTNGRAWGVDYLKYDWNPIEAAGNARNGRRTAPQRARHHFQPVEQHEPHQRANDHAARQQLAHDRRHQGKLEIHERPRGFGQDKWRKYSSPGHWNDPDMLEIATKERNQPGLTPDEEYTHMTLWCLLARPLLLANDMSQMDAFTKNLLENDEVHRREPGFAR